MISQAVRIIHRISREGYLYQDNEYETFFYKGDQYWRVNCSEGDFEFCRFMKGYPVPNDIYIDQKLYNRIREWSDDIHLLFNTFSRLEKLV